MYFTPASWTMYNYTREESQHTHTHTHTHGRFGMTQILLPGRMRCCSLTRCISSSTSRKRNLPNWEHSGEMGWNGFCEVVTAATTLSFLPLPGTSSYCAAAAAVAYRRHKVIDIARCLTDGTAEPHVQTHTYTNKHSSIVTHWPKSRQPSSVAGIAALHTAQHVPP